MIASLSSGEYLNAKMAAGVWILTTMIVSVVLVKFLGLFYLSYFFLSQPLRRQERARFFLDLLETGLAQGRSAEVTVVDVSKCRDRILGYRFHLLAADLEKGLRLSQGLKKVPGLVSPQLAAMLEVGERLGDIRKVLPACRQALSDASSKLVSGVNYMMICCLVLNPVGPVMWPFLWIYVVPQFKKIVIDLLGKETLPPLLAFLDAHGAWVTAVQVGLMLMLGASVMAYVAGPHSNRLVRCMADRVSWWLPWRRKRLQRDFSAMLALLLDSGVPEMEAVRLAAESTANGILSHHSEAVVAELAAGASLTTAVEALDDTGEFCWRMSNATHGRSGFHAALAGWHEVLGAQAYQQEQAASQVVTTALVLVNGVVVGLICVGMFQALTMIIWDAVLW